ncbi:hypothetical protein NFX46_19620 [Streptomyces phaeoluteigriseus]|uniref:Uncharacterized protein n=1 Tax=Streptomyces phaeoluteigriseus TaxID=114686 RepID=A0ABY4ZAR0_9ACTN|nr:hypothetical protein [Streptomyces phaeoluteigriseus]USQ85770.1 hypothetical protein NFX46_19620 [Streptomyces phaeoluteigriseus]
MAAISVVLDHTTATALYDPKDPFNEAVAAFYVQASGGLGSLYAPVLSLTASDVERPGLLSYIKGLRFIRIEAFDTDAAVTATELAVAPPHGQDSARTLLWLPDRASKSVTRNAAVRGPSRGRAGAILVAPGTG